MNILGIDCTTMCGSVALLSRGTIVSEHCLNISATHATRLLSSIDGILSAAEMKPESLNCLAISVGPGSFTGLRLGLATIKGISFPFDIPVTPVSSLDVIAANFPFARYPVCAVIDARRSEVYSCLYSTEEGLPKRLGRPETCRPEDLAAGVGEKTILAGSGAILYRELFSARLADRVLFPPLPVMYPRGSNVAIMGEQALQDERQMEGSATDELEPIYIRESAAEKKRRELRPGAELIFRKLNFLHVDDILAIESEAFSDPWPLETFLEIVLQQDAKSIVAEENGEPIAYMIAYIYPGELHITNLAVRKDRRRQGIGSVLLEKVLEFAEDNRCRRIFLEVRPTNRIAVQLYDKFGFSKGSMMKNYYSSQGEDAIVMEKFLTAEAPETPDVTGPEESTDPGPGESSGTGSPDN